METMTNELTVIPRTIGMMTRMMNAVNIEDAVIVSEEEQKEHPNFIESNTSGITLEELERNCIVPSFGDNQLTISHQKFIHQVEDAAKVYFTGENFGNTEIRVSHKILGRVPGALTKRKEELRPEDETIYYQRMAFCFHIRSMSRMMNGEEVHLCIGGVRSLNEENLYARKSPEKFKIFIGWRVRVCSNLDSHLIRLQTVLPDYPYDRLDLIEKYAGFTGTDYISIHYFPFKISVPSVTLYQFPTQFLRSLTVPHLPLLQCRLHNHIRIPFQFIVGNVGELRYVVKVDVRDRCSGQVTDTFHFTVKPDEKIHVRTALERRIAHKTLELIDHKEA